MISNLLGRLSAGPLPAYDINIEVGLLERRGLNVSLESNAVRSEYTEEISGNEAR